MKNIDLKDLLQEDYSASVDQLNTLSGLSRASDLYDESEVLFAGLGFSADSEARVSAGRNREYMVVSICVNGVVLTGSVSLTKELTAATLKKHKLRCIAMVASKDNETEVEGVTYTAKAGQTKIRFELTDNELLTEQTDAEWYTDHSMKITNIIETATNAKKAA